MEGRGPNECANGWFLNMEMCQVPRVLRDGAYPMSSLLPEFQQFRGPSLLVELEKNKHCHAHVVFYQQHLLGNGPKTPGDFSLVSPSQVQAGQRGELGLLWSQLELSLTWLHSSLFELVWVESDYYPEPQLLHP